MPPPLPDRYRLEVRLGRDHDVEEWLAVDTALDRPVLIRVLGPDSSEARRTEFLAAVRQASAVTNPYVAAVYEAGTVAGGVYAVCEWGGGVTMGHRLDAGETMTAQEFLPNAAGLADGLAALHAAGGVHGAIDPGAILYSAAHPAKLTAFGRPAPSRSDAADVRDLAVALETSLTGRAPDGVPPSEVVDGLPPQVDAALDGAARGALGARGLADALHGAPTMPPNEQLRPDSPWRGLALTAGLLALAGAVVAVGASLTARPQSPVLFPATPTTRPAGRVTTLPPTTTPPTTAAAGAVALLEVEVFDPPPGDNVEHDDELPFLTDGDRATVWTTERYRVPVWRFKPGVGVTFRVEGTPRTVQLVGLTAQVSWSLAWSNAPAENPEAWERLAAGRAGGATAVVQVPPRQDGSWLLWLTDLPDIGGAFGGSVAEVRFRP